MSKVQSDNQIRFQDLETALSSDENLKLLTKKIQKIVMKFCQGVRNHKT